MNMAREVSNSEDIVDSRDVIARIEELEGERSALLEEMESIDGDDYETATERDAAEKALADWDGENKAELDALKALADECEGYASDWRHGETLIRDSHFTEYAQELAEDVCDMGKASDWPFRCIDWEEAAAELKQDYTEVDWDGVAYWIRCS